MTTTTQAADVKVGDEVRVFNGSTRDGEWGTVVKVGRKLVTIQNKHKWNEVFRLDTQHGNGPQYGYGTWFRTLEQVAVEERRQESVATLRSVHLVLDHGWTLTTEQLEELAAVVKGWSA